MEVKDSNGSVLITRDSVIVIKTLIAKGIAKDIKKGTGVKTSVLLMPMRRWKAK